MTTLIICTDGESIRRCDAKCYNATGETCTCVCGGMNHGVGESAAKANIDALLDELLFEACESEIESEPIEVQLVLPGFEHLVFS